jgi:hypothetical protein
LLEFAGSLPEPEGGEPAGGYCVDNIGPKGRALRWRFGWLAFCFGLALAAGLVLAGAERWWRLAVYLPFSVAGVNWRQALEKT